MEITQILILILLFKPQSDHVHLSYLSPPPVSPNTLHNYHREPIIQHNYIPLLSKLLSWHPYPHNFPLSKELSPPLSPILSLPPLDLTPPTQNTSESDISDDFLDPNYDDTNDDYGIPFEQPPSRPMVNY